MSDLVKRRMSFQTTDGRAFEVLAAAHEYQRNIDLLEGLTKLLDHSIRLDGRTRLCLASYTSRTRSGVVDRPQTGRLARRTAVLALGET